MRWGNVGRAAVVVGVLALVVAWPRLAPEPPRMPSDDPIPLVSPSVEVGERGERRRVRKAVGPRVRGERRQVRKAVGPRVRGERRQVRKAVGPRVAGPRAPRSPPPHPPPSTPRSARPLRFAPTDPATTEFSFETG